MDSAATNFTLLDRDGTSSRRKGNRDYKKRDGATNRMYYRVNENPPWAAAILLGFQQVMVCISGVIAMPTICLSYICGEDDSEARMLLISTTLVIAGISTILQTTLGLRLPMLQGPSAAFIAPVIALGKTFDWFRCPSENDGLRAAWMDRIVYLQGGQIVASLVQMTVGATGIIGFATKFIGPITIAPLMMLLALSLVEVMTHHILLHWMSAVTIGLLFFFSLYMADLTVPLPTYRKEKWWTNWVPVFSLFPYILAVGISWLLCVIFTYSGVFNDTTDIAARVDGNRSAIIGDSPWFRFPYPGQWGVPRVSVAVVVGMVAATVCSVLESLGDYHACGRVACEPRPPKHAINRGILAEGFCCFVGGFLGGGLSVTSFSEVIGAIGITKVASRITVQIAGVIMILMGLFTKFGALLATIPEPLFGGTLFLSMSVVMGVGVSSLQLADMSLTRNMAIVGAAVLSGLLVPDVVEKRPINSGIGTLDDTITMFCRMPLIIGGLVGFILDNTVPGANRRQRGLREEDTNADALGSKTYSFPSRVMKILRFIPFARYLPFLPPLQKS